MENTKKEKTNEWTGIGIVVPRSGKSDDEIVFYPFPKNGGGVIHFSLKCEEPAGADANGQPRVETVYVPVDVMANKLITVQQLQTIRSGMRVRVVGRLKLDSYENRKNGAKTTRLIVRAFVLEVLQSPATQQGPQPFPQGIAPQQQGGYPGYMPQQGGYPGYAVPQPAYQQGPQYGGTPPYGAQPQPGYQPQGTMAGGYPGYMPPQGGYQGYAGPQPGATGIEDLPL